MKLGDTILIIPSDELIGMQMMELAFRRGQIVEIRRNWMGIFGAWIELEGEPYIDEQEWFIPIKSLEYE
jgi:hypothetical protein